MITQYGWRSSLKIWFDGEASATEAAGSLEPRHPEPTPGVESGKHNVFAHFPKDRNCDVCNVPKLQGPLAENAPVITYSRAENVADLIAADHNAPNEECESRNCHRYAVIVQDLATIWLQAHPCKTQTSQEAEKSLQKVSRAEGQFESDLHRQFNGFWQRL